MLSITKDGFEPQLITINYPAAGDEPIEFSQTVTLVKAKVVPPKEVRPTPPPRVISGNRVRNVYFDFGSSYYHKEDVVFIEQAIQKMKQDASLKLELDGHSDVVGMERYNKSLSIKRAERVKLAMVKGGIAANRIMVKGFGSDKPLATNDQEKEGRELNRRVEFKLIK